MYFIRISFIKLKNITVIPVNKHILFAIPVRDGDVSQNRQIISLNPIIKRPFVTNPRHLMTRVDFLRPSETNGHSGRWKSTGGISRKGQFVGIIISALSKKFGGYIVLLLSVRPPVRWFVRWSDRFLSFDHDIFWRRTPIDASYLVKTCIWWI